MKTPIQEHIEWLDKMWGNAPDTGINTLDFELAMMHANSLLDKEKEVIMDAHHCGRAFENKYPASDKHYDESAEEYYNETFNTKE